MTKNIGPMIAASARVGLGYAERLLGDVPDDKFGAFAKVGNGQIKSNHPAFVCGHLSLYAPEIMKGLGHETSGSSHPILTKHFLPKTYRAKMMPIKNCIHRQTSLGEP